MLRNQFLLQQWIEIQEMLVEGGGGGGQDTGIRVLMAPFSRLVLRGSKLRGVVVRGLHVADRGGQMRRNWSSGVGR
jgi:hypothetical protein